MSGVALGTLATAGVVLAVVLGDTQVLRLAVVASWLVALSLVGYSVRRGRSFARETALAESARRRDESIFTQQMTALGASINGLQAQLERMSAESAELRSEVAQLRIDKIESDEIVRRARAERARARLAEREAADQRLLTAAAFEAAAAVLQSFGHDDEQESGPGDWVASWVASLGACTELDLTMHDDTIEIDLDAALADEVEDIPVAKSA